MNQVNQRSSEWSTGLCQCTHDAGNCLTTCLCPCVTFGQIANIVDRGMWPCGCLISGTIYAMLCCMGMCCLCSCFYRTNLRKQYHLNEGPLPDCLVHLCCEYCALCQEYRELKNRGFNLAIGWETNMERQHGATGPSGAPVMGAPALNGAMMR